MIGFHEFPIHSSVDDQALRLGETHDVTRAPSPTDASLPLLAEIAGQLIRAGERDEVAALRQARRLLEKAFHIFDDKSDTEIPSPITELRRLSG